MFAGKKITAGITGGIAAYKAAEIVSWLKQNGADVEVVMTEGATHFITPLTMKTLSGRPVALELMDTTGRWQVPHIDLAGCDLFLVLPATANILAKAAHGLADDLLSAALLATAAPVLAAPAMNTQMYANPATQANLVLLKERGWGFIEPGSGRLACGAYGQGRLADLEVLKAEITRALLAPEGPLMGKRVLVSAGPTYEYIDPVRFIGNRSSGKMGYALAEAARQAGAQVTLVSGPTALADPSGVATIRVVSARDMYDAIWANYPETDIVIMAAAVADYRPEQTAAHKIKKGGAQTLNLVANADILASLGREKGGRFLVGFAAETDRVAEYAAQKLRDKHLDLMIANDVSAPGAGFDHDTNIITAFWPDAGKVAEKQYPLMRKRDAATEIVKLIAVLLQA